MRRYDDKAVDYAGRKRNAEWRERWFYLDRSRDDREFLGRQLRGLELKWKMIKEQRETADTITGYAPAGAGTPWLSIGPRNVNGRVKALAVHPTDHNTVYAGAASGGVWKSIDAGQSWRPLWDSQDTMAVAALAVAPSAPDTVYAGTGEWTPGWGPGFAGTGLFSSTDGGATWAKHGTLTARRVAQVVVSHTDPNRVYVAGENGLERSNDGGSTWSVVHAGEASDVVIDPTNANVLYINVRSDGVYKTTDAGATWSKLAAAPSGAAADWVRLAIGRSGTHGGSYVVAKRSGAISRSTDGGATWTAVAGTHGDASYHAWCNLLAVAPDDENVILAGGVSLERSADGGATWSSAAGGLHSDHHRAVFAPSNTSIAYSCNDGGVYRSTNKGATFTKVSDGLIVTQFYDVGCWSPIATVLGGGTQDNGSNMTTGGLTWQNIFGWDGGYFVIDPANPRVMYAEHQNTDVHKSIDGGTTWVQKTAGITGSSPWTGVLTIDPADSNRLYVGTQQVFRTTDGCATAWTASSQALAGDVTSIAVADSNHLVVYAGTSGGNVMRSGDAGATSPWADKSAGLPGRAVKDVVVDRFNADRVVVAVGDTSGGTAQHVYLTTNGGTMWNDISGNLPDVPVNAVAFHPSGTTTIYAGTDVGVFRTTNAGTSWQAFDNGLPNVPVTDLQVDPIGNLLVCATFGRGMYKVGISGAVAPTVDLYLRDSLLDTGERLPSPSGQPNPNDPLDTVFWWESPDLKPDTQPFYVPDALFDGVEFDSLAAEDPQRTESNRFYLQVHNRGWQTTSNVRARVFIADASAGLPALPNALTPPDFTLGSTASWAPLGPAQTIATLEPNRPVILSWDFTLPASTATHSCLLAVVSSPDDPMTNPETNVDLLVSAEKRVGLRNLHVVNSGPSPQQLMTPINFHNARDHRDLVDIVIRPEGMSDGSIGLLLEPVDFEYGDRTFDGVEVYQLREGEDIGKFYRHRGDKDEPDRRELLKRLDLSRVFEFDAARLSAMRGLVLEPGQRLQGLLTFRASKNVQPGQTQRFTVVQEQAQAVVGGGTYELRLNRARGLHPVSHIRVVLERLEFEGDGAGQRLVSTLSINGDPCRQYSRRLARIGKDDERKRGVCVFDGYVAESDRATFSITGLDHEGDEPRRDQRPLYTRVFDDPPEMWVGRYRTGDGGPDREHGTRVSYRIESLPLT
jgi:photosystem II stability/assembly factor-like uncharacterized protein